ncbi:MAG TPA: hypothetical protein VGF24_19240 [Vicinamibacterales bacterium]|jgi:hypothetical protein
MKYSVFAVVVVAGAALAAGSVETKEESIAGPWTFSVEHIGLKLVLEQKKSAVTGTLDWPHGDPVKLTGMFADDALVFSGESTGENFTIHIDSTGTRKADGTLMGTVKAHFDEFNDAHQVVRTRNQEIPWTAVRGLRDVVHFPR